MTYTSRTDATMEQKIAHLSMIQGVINRLASNASSMKSLAGTIAAAAIALYGTISHFQWVYLAAASLPVMTFWFLDVRYLSLEKAYRGLYDAVRTDQKMDAFSMDYRPFIKSVPSTAMLLFTWSVIWFYGAILIAFVLIYLGTAFSGSAPVAGA
jgi:uncharacterized membrane protein